jgi:hypothetical protein
MADKDMRQWLAEQQADIDSAASEAAKPPTFENPPDGNYEFELEEVDLGVSNNSGRRQVKWVWAIIECADESWIGKKKYNYQGLEGDNAWKFFLMDLKKFGYEPEQVKATKIPEILSELSDRAPRIRGSLVTKKGGDFQNLYIKKVLDDDLDGVPEVAGKPVTDVEVGNRVIYKYDGAQVEGNVAQVSGDEITIRSGRNTRKISIKDVLKIVEAS